MHYRNQQVSILVHTIHNLLGRWQIGRYLSLCMIFTHCKVGLEIIMEK